MEPFNELTPAQAERLALLSEELGEAQQAIGKILRHGYAAHHPLQRNGPNNRESLEKELGDVFFAVKLLCANELEEVNILAACDSKNRTVWDYFHHQDEARKRFERVLSSEVSL